MNNLGQSAKHLGIDEENLATRRAFLRIDHSDQMLLAKLIPWIDAEAPGLARAFYDWQFSFGPTADFFEAYTRKKGVSVQELRQQLEEAQAGYLRSIFHHAQTGWGVAYFEERLHVGAVHDAIDLPFKWYVGSYCEWRALIQAALTRFLGEEPQALATISQIMLTIEKLFNLDLQAIGDSFLIATLESLGMSIGDVTADPGKDRTEHIGDIKTQLAARAARIVSSVVEVNENLESIAAASEQLSMSSSQIAERTDEVSGLSSEAVDVADQASLAIAKLSGSSDEIEKVVSTISSVADKTNLLALNATIEAARAGAAGNGFSVVANEVKGLANRTADATTEIADGITGIRSEIDSVIESLSAIVHRVKSVNELQLTMASAVEEQLTAIRELGRNLADVSGASDDIREQVRLFEKTAHGTVPQSSLVTA